VVKHNTALVRDEEAATAVLVWTESFYLLLLLLLFSLLFVLLLFIFGLVCTLRLSATTSALWWRLSLFTRDTHAARLFYETNKLVADHRGTRKLASAV